VAFSSVATHEHAVSADSEDFAAIPPDLLALGDDAWRDTLRAAVARAPSPLLAVAGLGRLFAEGGADALRSWPVADLADLLCVVGSSPALTRHLVGHGAGWPLAAAFYRERNPGIERLVERTGITHDDDFDAIARSLRRMARSEMYRIGARDLLGLATLDETLDGITTLADAALRVATDRLRPLHVCETGDALDDSGRPIPFVVLGLGKLGGQDLNYSSDIDVAYYYAHDAPMAGGYTAREFFSRLAKDISRAIGDTTADGQVFRVDLRLRPEGGSGPLVNTVANALMYYEGWGDTWERGVYIKARPVAGDPALGDELIEGIRPFVFRRHLDYQTIEDFRAMKERIDAEQSVRRMRSGGVRDVKLGAGGIRELEFVVQILQLIHGGHDDTVRVRGTMAALSALESGGMIASDEAAGLRTAYEFLRNVEHAVQVVEQRQTQKIPEKAEDLRALARRLGYGVGRRGAAQDADEIVAFERDWTRHTTTVRDAFLRFLELREDEAPRAAAVAQLATDPIAVTLLGMIERGEMDEAAALLEEIGFADGARSAASLSRIYRGRVSGPASPQRRRAVERMAPHLLHAALDSADPQAAVDRLVDFLIRTGAHTSYMALLGGSPATMEVLVRLFATSPYLAAHLVGHPELLDSLVRSDRGPAARNEESLTTALLEELDGASNEEEVLAALRRFRVAETIRIGLDDLGGEIAAAEVFASLTLLADVCVSAAAEQARRIVEASRPGATDRVDLAVVALGKMGAGEMGYASDLDLLFVYESRLEGFDGDAHSNATRWAQKMIGLLQAQTRDGIVYKIDARLRPSGRSGPLVASIERFVDYHRTEAELWERQAHIRARVVYGSERLRRRIEATIDQLVYGAGLDADGIREIDGLRTRVENELAAEGPGRTNVKTGRGGIVDIEFLVQMLLLRHGHEHPIVQRRGTAEAIVKLAEAGLMPAEDAATLTEAYRFLRVLEARMRLERDRAVEQLGTDPDVLAPLARRLGFTGEHPGAELLARYERTRDEVRAVYERYFRGVDV
jgi:glutamate-ammonia-ligase adenylyltransferase